MALHPPQLVSVTPFLLSDDIGLLYSPALLLDAGLDASITDHSDFYHACHNGFRDFFGELYKDDEEGDEVFLGCSYMWRDVQREIVGVVARRYDAGERFHEQKCGFFPSMSLRAGSALGWLSALALLNRPLALQGIDLLLVLVPSCQREETGRAA